MTVLQGDRSRPSFPKQYVEGSCEVTLTRVVLAEQN
jgi:hypothetical protein